MISIYRCKHFDVVDEMTRCFTNDSVTTHSNDNLGGGFGSTPCNVEQAVSSSTNGLPRTCTRTLDLAALT